MNILTKAETIIQYLDQYQKDIDYKQNQIFRYESDINLLENKKKLILVAKEYHSRAIDILYKSSIKELEDLINNVVASIFYDRDLSIQMELTDSRNKSLTWCVTDNVTGIQMDADDGVGRGIQAVLSFIIQSYYVLSLGSKYMFIDEGYTYISEEYVGKFFEFVKLLCKEKGLALVMISHDTRFIEYADTYYFVSNGVIYKDQDALTKLSRVSEGSQEEEFNGDRE